MTRKVSDGSTIAALKRSEQRCGATLVTPEQPNHHPQRAWRPPAMPELVQWVASRQVVGIDSAIPGGGQPAETSSAVRGPLGDPVPPTLRGSMRSVRLRTLVPVFLVLVVATTLVTGAAGWELVTFGTARQMPRLAADFSPTPAGWVPVAFGEAEISVPAGFNVFYLDSECGSILRPGTVFVGDGGVSSCSPGTIQPNGTLFHFHQLTRNPASWRNEKPMRLNGLSVYLGPGMDPYLAGYGLEYEANDYIAPSLDVEVAGVGPLAKQVLNTLTGSPRVLALASGSSPMVPSSWQSVSFAGLQFSVPGNWPITRTQVTPGLGAICRTQGVAFSDTAVILSTDARPLLRPPCPLFSPTPQQPANGVQVDSGLSTEPTVMLSFSAHCLDLHGLTTCPAISPAYSILVLRVRVPGHTKPVYVSIGLAGNGMLARTILYSLRAA